MVMDVARQREIFSDNLKRHMVGRNQNDVAAYIGVSPQTFNTWYRGKSVPRADKLQKLADYFWVRPSELLEEYKPEEQKKFTAAESIRSKIGQLDSEGQKVVDNLIESLLKMQKQKDPIPVNDKGDTPRVAIMQDSDGNFQEVVIIAPKTEK